MRDSLLIHCSNAEAREVRSRATFQRRTVSGYVVNIVLRRVDFAEEISAGGPATFKLRPDLRAKIARPRTTLHIYCARDEANRIRGAARRGKLTISSFVRHCLRSSWEIEDSLSALQRKNIQRLQNRLKMD